MSETLTIKLATKREELARLQAEIEQLGEREEWDATLLFHVNLAVEELATNIMDYGFSEGVHEFEIAFRSEPDCVTIDLWDEGSPFDPTSDAPEPDLDATLEDRRIGGLGVYFAETLMDEMRYEREQDKNHLTLVKRRD